MKKLALTIAVVLGISFGAFAQGGMFGYGRIGETYTDWGPTYWNTTQDWTRTVGGSLILPTTHGSGTDQNGVPAGSGALLLIGFGAAYALKKRQK
ncbi:MAG: hypothetical protein K6F96_08950 [Bacteroidales bacterium]|nr:hypothetical protein [Bacteroidales bacterium]